MEMDDGDCDLDGGEDPDENLLVPLKESNVVADVASVAASGYA